jgi:hypothetical protein
MTKALFTEKQKFRQKWLIAVVVLTAGIAIYGFIQQIVFGLPFGNNPAPDIVMVLLLLVPLGLFWLFFSFTLHTRIDRYGITYMFFPVHRRERSIPWDSVKQVFVRKYKPIAEYGGWGFRMGRSGTAFNTGGNMGLQIVLNDGKKILIGTQQPVEMKNVLDKLGKSNPVN